jgi:hypothetical protein
LAELLALQGANGGDFTFDHELAHGGLLGWVAWRKLVCWPAP